MKSVTDYFDQHFWSEGPGRRIPGLVSLLVLILLMQSLATLTWKIVPSGKLEQVTIDTGRTLPSQSRQVHKNLPVAPKIAQWHLFGKFEKNKAIDQPIVEQEVVPETRLNLKLRGVFSSTNNRSARAIIADSKGQEESYAIGDELPGNARLTQIHKDHVILQHNGRLETLRLPTDIPDSPIASNNRGRRNSASNRNSLRDRGSTRKQSSLPSSSSADTGTLLREYRDALVNNPQSVMGLVRAEPFNKNGKLAGYRIRPGKDRKLFRKFGLRSGDVVTSVNGVPMNNPIKALEVLRDLSTATSLTVDVERNGTPQTFTFPIDQ